MVDVSQRSRVERGLPGAGRFAREARSANDGVVLAHGSAMPPELVATIETFVGKTVDGFSRWKTPEVPADAGIASVMVGDVEMVFAELDSGVTIVEINDDAEFYLDDESGRAIEQTEVFVNACAGWSFPNMHPNSIWDFQFTSLDPDWMFADIGVAITSHPRGAGLWLEDCRTEASKVSTQGAETFAWDRGLSGFYANAQLGRIGGWIAAGVDLEEAARMQVAALGVQVAVHEAHEQTMAPDGSLIADPHLSDVEPSPVVITFRSGHRIVGTNLATPVG